MVRLAKPTWARFMAARLFERDRNVALMRSHLAARVGAASVVEAGCGFGFNAPNCAGEYLGLDVDSSAIRLARAEQPRGTFLMADATEPAVELRPRHTALLCLLLHEVAHRQPLIQAMAAMARERVLIYDYDPALPFLGRLRLSFWEPPALKSYWDLDLPGELSTLGFRLLETNVPAPTFRFWEFTRDSNNPIIHQSA